MLRRVDRCYRAADGVPDDDRAIETGGDDRVVDGLDDPLETLVRRRFSRRGRAGRRRSPGGPGAGVEHRIPTCAGRTCRRAGRRSAGRARRRRRAIVRRGSPSGSGRLAPAGRAGWVVANSGIGVIALSLVASCGRPPRCHVCARPATGRGLRVLRRRPRITGRVKPPLQARRRAPLASRSPACGTRSQVHLDRADRDEERVCAILALPAPAAASAATRRSLGVSESTPERAVRRGRAPAARSSTRARSASALAPLLAATPSLVEPLPRTSPLAAPAERGALVDQRRGKLDRRVGIAQTVDGRTEELLVAAEAERERAGRAPARARSRRSPPSRARPRPGAAPSRRHAGRGAPQRRASATRAGRCSATRPGRPRPRRPRAPRARRRTAFRRAGAGHGRRRPPRRSSRAAPGRRRA